MNYTEIAEHNDFHDWFEYVPHDVQYMRYSESNPSTLAAGYMIGDVYHTFAFARVALLFSLENNYGDLAKQEDEMANLNVKALFIQDAITQYAICEDLSWQVVWAYILPSDIEYLMKNEYEKMTKECNRDNLIEQLNCGIGQHSIVAEKLKEILKEFDDDPSVMEFRTLYNFLKHRGTVHIEGLGNEDEMLMFAVEGKPIRIRAHHTYKLEQLQSMARDYHLKFENYFNKIIKAIMPDDYKNSKISFVDGMNAILRMNEAQNK